MPVRHALPASLLLASLAALTGCGGGDGGGGPNNSPNSGATCPPAPGTSLRYTGGGNGGTEPANFGKTFFDSYCIGCHGPPQLIQNQNFTSYAGIIGRIGRIDQKAAAGPAQTNTFMPPTPTNIPTTQERLLLGTWIACGAPQQ